jgi:hypothetical protein
MVQPVARKRGPRYVWYIIALCIISACISYIGYFGLPKQTDTVEHPPVYSRNKDAVKVQPIDHNIEPQVIHKTAKHHPNSHKYLFGVKTGVEVAPDRAPIQYLTFLQHLKNVYYFSDDDVYIGNNFIHGVLKAEYAKAMGRKLLTDKIIQKRNVGWRLDRDKYFPALKEMWRKYPNVDWYTIIDDDTYIYFNAFDEFLSKKDPQKEYYFGSSRVFQGCGNFTSYANSPYFAYGGTGVVLSHAAMKKMMTIIDQCVVKYKKCYGDAFVAVCLLDVNIKFNWAMDEHGLHMEPPNDGFKEWPQNPCKTPIAFHHLLPKQTQKLYEVDALNPNNVLKKGYGHITNYGELFGHMNRDKPASEEGKGYKEKALAVERVTTAKECRALCKKRKTCRTWEFLKKESKCEIRSLIRPQIDVSGSKSGVITNHYQCNKH